MRPKGDIIKEVQQTAKPGVMGLKRRERRKVDVGPERAWESHQRKCRLRLSKLELDRGCMAVAPTPGGATWGWLLVRGEAG